MRPGPRGEAPARNRPRHVLGCGTRRGTSASVSAVTMPGVNGSGKEIYAVTQQNATQSAILVISLAVIEEADIRESIVLPRFLVFSVLYMSLIIG